MIFGEASALTGENVKQWFGLMEDNMFQEITEQNPNRENDEQNGPDNLENGADKKKKKGCNC